MLMIILLFCIIFFYRKNESENSGWKWYGVEAVTTNRNRRSSPECFTMVTTLHLGSAMTNSVKILQFR